MTASYIKELKDVIRRLHGVESEHVESVPVKETFQGRTVWEGIVEVFDLKGHPTAFRAYAWSVLHQHPIKSAQDAVKAAIVQEYRNLATEES
jgi:hypothetical protein